MKILYKPFAIIASLVGARIGQKAFKSMWAKLDDAEPPAATTAEASLPKVIAARSLEAATMAAVGATVDRASIRWFHHLTGIWPGPKTQQKPED
jgi:Protein of unknown function (DUF4235)